MEIIDEILSRRFYYYLQVRLGAGDKFLGRISIDGGYEIFWSDEQTKNKFSLRNIRRDIFSLIHNFETDFKNRFEYETRLRSLLGILIKNVEVDESALSFCYLSPRKDHGGRMPDTSIILFLSNQDAEEIIQIARKEFVQVLIAIMDKISSDLYRIAPFGDLSEFHYGVIELQANENWRYLEDIYFRQINRFKILI